MAAASRDKHQTCVTIIPPKQESVLLSFAVCFLALGVKRPEAERSRNKPTKQSSSSLFF